MKEEYVSPAVEVVEFETGDVITGSNDLPIEPFVLYYNAGNTESVNSNEWE